MYYVEIGTFFHTNISIIIVVISMDTALFFFIKIGELYKFTWHIKTYQMPWRILYKLTVIYISSFPFFHNNLQQYFSDSTYRAY